MKKLQAGAAGSTQPITKAKVARAPRIAGLKPLREPGKFLEASKSSAPTVLSSAETSRMWEIQHAAERDPAAFMEACRAKAR